MSADRPRRAAASKLSRRGFLTLSAAIAAIPAGLLRPGQAHADGHEEDAQAYQRAFQKMLDNDEDVRHHLADGQEFLYRPRQLLVADDDAERVHARLRKAGYPAEVHDRFAEVTQFAFDREVEIPEIVDWLRDPREWPKERPPAVQPHHVLVGFGNIMGNPGAPPRAAPALSPPDPERTGEGRGVLVGVCDTGIWPKAAGLHADWLGGSYKPERGDEDPVYTHDDVLAIQGAHGTFVAGVLRQAAPGVEFDPERALNRSGIGDERMLVRALSGLSPQVSIVNLSLGCFTQDDLPPLPVVNALATLPSTETVVVAAAGNAGSSRPSWPAALPKVVAVAAVEVADKVIPDPDSGFGPWVEACTGGTRHSTYVPGRLPLPDVPDRHFEGFATWRGTSFAAPYVAGRLAATMTEEGVSPARARSILLGGRPWHPDYGVLVP